MIAVAGLLSLGSCSSSGPPREVLTEEQFRERAAADEKETRETFRTIVGTILARIEAEVDSQTADKPAVLDILALSGGGDYGAFGAGVLVGWGEATDPSYRRPDFDVVTGVSTGALLAPYAYIGTDAACRRVESFYRNPKEDWVLDRGMLYFLPGNPSFMTIPGLERDIVAATDMAMVEQMAEQSRRGKLLAISATDLDLGRQKFWDVGREAEKAVVSGNLERIGKYMFASSAIPAAFPPIAIDDSLYADGGVTANVFLRLDPVNPDAVLPRWIAAHPDTPFPKVRYWIIINNQLRQPPKTVQSEWPLVMAPSMATAIRSATLAEVRWLSAQADYVNVGWGTDIEVRVMAISDAWRAPVAGDFQKETMESLADMGRKMGADPASWTVWTSPRSLAPLAPK